MFMSHHLISKLCRQIQKNVRMYIKVVNSNGLWDCYPTMCNNWCLFEEVHGILHFTSSKIHS